MLFAVTIFLGAFLLFQVQPLFGKFLLPYFGGTPAVWSTCMLFFQLLLVAGYGYGHGLTRLSPRRQALVHGGAIVLSVLGIAAGAFAWGRPLLPVAGLSGNAASPVAGILYVLGLGVGLPYLLLATTGPLLQAWFARLHPGRSPYRLYALSNLGSLLGLLTYPAVVEPGLALPEQAWLWGSAFVVYAGACVVCARSSATAPALPIAPGERPPLGKFLFWAALAACASTLLLAATNEICQDVAVVPFLWILPLSLYLVTFILCFEREGFYRRAIFYPGLLLSLAAAVWALGQPARTPILPQVAALVSVLFFGCMVCHGELARQKPAPQHLTGFYLAVSVGGAAGGLFVGLAAPHLFTAFFELHVALVGCGLLSVLALALDPASPLRRGPLVLGARVAAASSLLLLVAGVGVKAGAANEGVLDARRSFYGLVRIRESTADERPVRMLMHGRICHGFQLLDEAGRSLPGAYFGPGSGGALAIGEHPARGSRALRLGVIGLGPGIAATYTRPGDLLRAYEINPDVLDVASGPGASFSFLADAPARVELVLGDGRTLLEEELARDGSRQFDVLMVDAFSGDAVPAHLLTEEAFRLYLAHLAPGGILVAHISNRNLDLRPVVWGLADRLGLASRWVDRDGDSEVIWPTEWMLFAREEATLESPVITEAALPRDRTVTTVVWTDQRSNLLELVKW